MKVTHVVGIDVAANSFVASVVTAATKRVGKAVEFTNEPAGFSQFEEPRRH